MRRDRAAGRNWRVAVTCLATALLGLAACSRSPFVLTECVDGRPVVERTLDVAPPNC